MTHAGPLEDQGYCITGSFSRSEYSATIIEGHTQAPTPTVDKIIDLPLVPVCV